MYILAYGTSIPFQHCSIIGSFVLWCFVCFGIYVFFAFSLFVKFGSDLLIGLIN